MRLLIIGDPHASPRYPNDRFDALNALIRRKKPTHVVCTGDLGDFSSISTHDKGKRGWEQESLEEDFDSVSDATERLTKRAGDTRFVLIEGNHEYRCDRFVSENSPLHGLIKKRYSTAMSEWHRRVPFKKLFTLGGIGFLHFLPTKMGLATSGVNLGRSVLSKARMSMVVGHSHILDYAEDADASGRLMFGLSAGCMVAEEHDEGWSRGTDTSWWRGAILVDGVSRGYYRSMQFLRYNKGEFSP